MLAGLDYDQRVDAGKRVEKKILDALRAKGIKIEDPTSGQDMHDKIDGWWLGKGSNQKYPVQVKFRQSGNDILFEIIKDLDRNVVGRDLKSKSVLYLVADKHGTTRLFQTEPIKKKAQEILNIVQKDLEEDPRQSRWSGNGWEAKIQYDAAHGNRKLVAYFSPNVFNPLATWNLDLYEEVVRESLKEEVRSVLKELFS
jgi:hypothetical protein